MMVGLYPSPETIPIVKETRITDQEHKSWQESHSFIAWVKKGFIVLGL
jgi:hypothetical protein